MIVRAMEVESGLVLGFRLGELEGVATPHNDTLIIRAMTMANYDMAQVFIDEGSSVNVLFWVTLEQMGLNVDDLQHISTPLIKLSRYAVQPLS